jgi:hypothetical protein
MVAASTVKRGVRTLRQVSVRRGSRPYSVPRSLAETLCCLASLGAAAEDGRFFFFLILGTTDRMAFGGVLFAAAASADLVWSLQGTLAYDTRPRPHLREFYQAWRCMPPLPRRVETSGVGGRLQQTGVSAYRV